MPEHSTEHEDRDFDPGETIEPFVNNLQVEVSDKSTVEVDPKLLLEAKRLEAIKSAERRKKQDAAHAASRAREVALPPKYYDVPASEATPGTGFVRTKKDIAEGKGIPPSQRGKDGKPKKKFLGIF